MIYSYTRWLPSRLTANALTRRCTSNSSSGFRPIKTLLIANRGEIACRVIKTARRLGVRTVAVYSEADKNALHVKMADVAYMIGPASVESSYLRGDRILAVADKTNSDAIHPGYGFLSENVEFAQMCSDNNVTFVGPPIEAIRKMGIKSKSKEIMIDAQVPVIEGYHGSTQDDSFLMEEAEKMEFPVMIKAVRGGGGKGMRIATSKSQFLSQLQSARREAMNSFGNDEMLIEKFIQRPRHVEVQIFGDHHDNYVYLYERDCSVQRRHQKIIEEAPAPGIDSGLRRELGEAAVRAAQAVSYTGAGTVEFIFDSLAKKFYFMEMNTRLQVEHPITEMITQQDLVEWQLRVAEGKCLPLKQSEIPLKGHSFEGRVYAENCKEDFIPAPGPISGLNVLLEEHDTGTVRIESGVEEGDEISVYYDPMIAKVVTWGQDRESALLKLKTALSKYNISGLKTNIDFLMKLCDHDEFIAGNVHTDFIHENRESLLADETPSDEVVLSASLLMMELEKLSQPPVTPCKSLEYFRLFDIDNQTDILLESNGIDYSTGLEWRGAVIQKAVLSNGKNIETPHLSLLDNKRIQLTDSEGRVQTFSYLYDSFTGCITIFTNDGSFSFRRKPPKWFTANVLERGEESGDHNSPMPGVVQKVFVNVGDTVTKDQPLIVMIAMKMEYVVNATRDGTVTEIYFQANDNVLKGSKLLHVE